MLRWWERSELGSWVCGLRALPAAARRRPATLQLATAKLPSGVDKAAFAQHLYQWAATLTTNGVNLPFALPLKADPRSDGFQVRAAAGGWP